MVIKKSVLYIAVAIMFSGCGTSQEVKKEAEKKPVLSRTEEMHQKAKFTEAASLVGYDGKAIKQNLDQIIDQTASAEQQLKDLNNL